MEKTILYFVPLKRVATYLKTTCDIIRDGLPELILNSSRFKCDLVILNAELKKYEKKYLQENNSRPTVIHRSTYESDGKVYPCIIYLQFSDDKKEQKPVDVKDDGKGA